MTTAICDKGPILDTLLNSMSELQKDQKVMVNALVSIAQHQERLVALADKTEENKNSITMLFKLQRESEAHLSNAIRDIEQKLNLHMLNHPSMENCKVNGLFSQGKDDKFSKVQISVIVTFILFMATQLWEFVRSTLAVLKSLTGA